MLQKCECQPKLINPAIIASHIIEGNGFVEVRMQRISLCFLKQYKTEVELLLLHEDHSSQIVKFTEFKGCSMVLFAVLTQRVEFDGQDFFVEFHAIIQLVRLFLVMVGFLLKFSDFLENGLGHLDIINQLLITLFMKYTGLIAFTLISIIRSETDHGVTPSQDTDPSHQQHSEHAIPTISLMIFFIFGSLIFGGIVKQITKRLKPIISIPYTPLLFVCGILFGVFKGHFSYFGLAVEKIIQISPEGILMIFLPVLIFESAFNADWHIFRKQFGQIFILSFPCVFCGAILIMISLKLIVGYYDDTYYTWPAAFLFGSILSCTDTVAVISLLKEIGAPKKFNSLIEGESLLNDGSCMVLLIISSEVVKGKPGQFMDMIGLFFSLTLGGVILGVIFGVISTFWIRRIFNDGIQAVSITMISCYMVFFIAEDVDLGFHISGIIALVSLGLYMAAFGRASFNVEVEGYVEGFWTYAVFCAQTTIFIISGILVGTKVFTVANANIVVDDFYKLLILYVCMIGARFISISLFMGVLPSLGYGLTWRDVYVLTYGGLRGAIGLSFSLIVYNDTQYSQRLRDIVLFDMAGNVILTLIINGTTTGFFVKLVGLSSSSKVKQKMFLEFVRFLMEECDNHKFEMQEHSVFPSAVFEKLGEKTGKKELRQLADSIEQSIDSKGVRYTNRKRKNTGLEVAINNYIQQNQPLQNRNREQRQSSLEQQEIISQVRSRFLMALKKKYWEFNQTNNTSAEATIVLIEATNFDIDKESEEMSSFEWIRQNIPKNSIRFLYQYKANKIFGGIAGSFLFKQVSYAYDIISSFIQAQQKVRSQAEGFGFDKKYLQPILRESRLMQKEAKGFLDEELVTKYPQISRQVQTRKASFHMLEHTKKDILDRYFKTGQIDHNQYSLLMNKIDKRIASLELETPTWKNLNFEESLSENVIFKELPHNIIKALENESTSSTFVEGDILARQNSSAKYLYLIRRGILTTFYKTVDGQVETKLTLSNLAGLSSVVSKTYKTTIIATTPVDASIIKIKNFLKTMDGFPKFEQAFWKKYLHIFIKMYAVTEDHSLYTLAKLPKAELVEALKKTQIKYLNSGKHVLENNCILLRGSLANENQQCIQLLKKGTQIEVERRVSLCIDPTNEVL